MQNFATLGLSQPLLKAIQDMGFEHPTPIQEQAIPKLLGDPTDLVGLAQTGTGKTAAFGLPLIDLVETGEPTTQALIIAPTRELCLQISKELELFGKQHKQINILAVYGGTDISRHIRALRRPVHIIAATPGRLRDLIKRKAVDLSEVRYVVLDEADEMLNMGFKEEIDEILDYTPVDKNTWLFSATMPPEVRRIAQTYMSNPLEISIGSKNTANVDIDHQYVEVHPRQRYEALKRFLDFDPDIFGLVFTRTRRDAAEVAEQLSKDGYRADALHGDMNQQQRDRVMEAFRSKRLQMLVATDVAARGIDVNDITHVFHYNIPEDISFYTHRSGRTGRAGRKGISMILMHPKDKYLLNQVERRTKVKFSLSHIPTGREICEKRLLLHMSHIKNMPVLPDLEDFMPAITEQLEDISKEDLIKRVASLSFSRYFKAYRHAPDLNTGGRPKKDRSNRSQNFKRLFINVGGVDVDGKGGFLAYVCGNTNIPGSCIGRIELSAKYAFFDVESELADQVIDRLNGHTIEGRTVRVNEENTPLRKDKKKKKKHRKGNRSFDKRYR